MATSEIKLTVKLAWWLRPYLAALLLACMVTQAEPDWVKLDRVLAKSIRII